MTQNTPIPLALDAALGRRNEIVIFGGDYDTEDGTAVRDYVHVTDLANAHVKALNYLVGGGETIYANLGTGIGALVETVIATAEKVVGKAISRQVQQRRAGDPARLVADAAWARRVLNWQPDRSDTDKHRERRLELASK